MKEEDKKKAQTKLKVKVSEGVESGVYTNAVSVNFNTNECVLDMAYKIPNAADPTIKIVSRINMSHKMAESLLKVLSNAVLDWKNKNNEKTD